jgi:hypothetical protein
VYSHCALSFFLLYIYLKDILKFKKLNFKIQSAIEGQTNKLLIVEKEEFGVA